MAKILLAEDDGFSRDMLTRRLERQGFEMVAVPDGREALHAARTEKPDLILMDLEMPVMDGRAAMSALRSDPRTFRIPIIVLTAHTAPEDVAKAIEAGCHSYETKPIALRRLVERIHEALGAKPGPNVAAAPADPVPGP